MFFEKPGSEDIRLNRCFLRFIWCIAITGHSVNRLIVNMTMNDCPLKACNIHVADVLLSSVFGALSDLRI